MRRFLPVRHRAFTLIGAALLLNGCQGMPLPVQGCLAGGGLGASVGAIADRNAGQGAGIGGLSGCALGAVAGSALEHRQNQYANAEQDLQRQTQEAQVAAQQQRAAADHASLVTSRYEHALRPLLARMQAGRTLSANQITTLQRAKYERDAMAASVNKGQTKLAEIDGQVAALQKAGKDTTALQAEERDLQESTNRLQSSLDAMTQSLSGLES